MKKQLERKKDEEFQIEDTQNTKEYMIETGGDQLAQIKETHDFEQMNQR
jgi:hypothetical protein